MAGRPILQASVLSQVNEAKTKRGVSVVIPTYRRPAALLDCLRSLLQGTEQPAEIIVAGRLGDSDTEQAIAKFTSTENSGVIVHPVWVTVPGHIPPVEAALCSASNELLAVIDDDVTVQPDWLEKIVPHFSDPAIGVVGGRVIVPGAPIPRLKGRPGRVSWYGKHWGNVASMDGEETVEVDTVMECNWVWRRDLLRSVQFDPVLKFDDSSMYGLDLTLQAKEKGFRIAYDPNLVVLHHIAPRTDELDRANRPRRIFSYCRNYTYIMLKRSPWWRRPIFLSWWLLIGSHGAWGPLGLAADVLIHGRRNDRHSWAAFRGMLEGARIWLTSR
ncbi:MAG: glycosyltransferase family 2 protein [Candidatus Acidiferrales bacterium]